MLHKLSVLTDRTRTGSGYGAAEMAQEDTGDTLEYTVIR